MLILHDVKHAVLLLLKLLCSIRFSFESLDDTIHRFIKLQNEGGVWGGGGGGGGGVISLVGAATSIIFVTTEVLS